MTAPANPAQLDLALDRWPGATSAPHIHIQAQTLLPGITDRDDRRSAAAEDPAHHPMLFRGVSLVRAATSSWPTAVEPAAETSSARFAEDCQSAIRRWSAAKGPRPRSGS
jgi:hypothetical protein